MPMRQGCQTGFHWIVCQICQALGILSTCKVTMCHLGSGGRDFSICCLIFVKSSASPREHA